MQKVNVAIIYHHTENKILMCLREKEPYKGRYNLLGGKVEDGEDELEAIYREVFEESGITSKDIELTWIMNIQFKLDDCELEVFAGKLNKEVELVEEINKLSWMSLDEYFGDKRFAGEGNIQYMLNYIDEYYSWIRK